MSNKGKIAGSFNAISIPNCGKFLGPDNVYTIMIDRSTSKPHPVKTGNMMIVPASDGSVSLNYHLRANMPHTANLENTRRREVLESCFALAVEGEVKSDLAKKILNTVESLTDEKGKTLNLKMQLLPAAFHNRSNIGARKVKLFLVSTSDVISEAIIKHFGKRVYNSLRKKNNEKIIEYGWKMLLGEGHFFKDLLGRTPTAYWDEDKSITIEDKKVLVEGDIGASKEVMDLLGGAASAKATFTSKSMIYHDAFCDKTGYDFRIFPSENKLDLHKTTFLSKIGYRPSGCARIRSGKSVGSAKFQTMIIQQLMHKSNLEAHKQTLESGKPVPEILDRCGTYYDKNGKIQITAAWREFYLAKGAYINEGVANKDELGDVTGYRSVGLGDVTGYRSVGKSVILNTLTNSLKEELYIRNDSKAFTGVVCDIKHIPDHIKAEWMVLNLYPNPRPILVKVKIWREEGLIGIPLWVIFGEGRDLDGDIVLAVPPWSCRYYFKPEDLPLNMPNDDDVEESNVSISDTWTHNFDNVADMGKTNIYGYCLYAVAAYLGWDQDKLMELLTKNYIREELIIRQMKHRKKGGEEQTDKEYALSVGFTEDDMQLVDRESEFSRFIRNLRIDWAIPKLNELEPKGDAPFLEKLVYINGIHEWEVSKNWFPRSTARWYMGTKPVLKSDGTKDMSKFLNIVIACDRIRKDSYLETMESEGLARTLARKYIILKRLDEQGLMPHLEIAIWDACLEHDNDVTRALFPLVNADIKQRFGLKDKVGK